MAVHSRYVALNERASSQSSDKLLQILECIAGNKLPVRLQDLSEQVNMTQSTVLRYLNTLVNNNYVYQEEDTLRYALTWKIAAWGKTSTPTPACGPSPAPLSTGCPWNWAWAVAWWWTTILSACIWTASTFPVN